jgi:hypothetical protein
VPIFPSILRSLFIYEMPGRDPSPLERVMKAHRRLKGQTPQVGMLGLQTSAAWSSKARFAFLGVLVAQYS